MKSKRQRSHTKEVVASVYDYSKSSTGVNGLKISETAPVSWWFFEFDYDDISETCYYKRGKDSWSRLQIMRYGAVVFVSKNIRK